MTATVKNLAETAVLLPPKDREYLAERLLASLEDTETEFPHDLELPFFAYGIFKPGELGFLQLRDLASYYSQPCSIKGDLLLRDGLPVIDSAGRGQVEGALIVFHPGKNLEAYTRIAQLEPGSQYRWDVASVSGKPSNYLAGRSPRKGSVQPDDDAWSGKNDPLFTDALEVVEETMKTGTEFCWLPSSEPNLKPLFRLEMAYLLLWSAIERYCSFRYGLGENVTAKIKRMAGDPTFGRVLQEVIQREMSRYLNNDDDASQPAPKVKVFRADKPKDSYMLRPDDPEESLRYYYQIRCNAAHRGKGVVYDHERLEKALSQMLEIFRNVLAGAFEESNRPLSQT